MSDEEANEGKPAEKSKKSDLPKYNPYGMNPLPRDNLYESLCYEIYRNLHRRFYLMGPWVVLVGTKFFVIPIKNYSGAIHFQLGPELQIFLYYVVDRDVKLPEYGKSQLKAVEEPEKNAAKKTEPAFFGYEPIDIQTNLITPIVKTADEYLKLPDKHAKSPQPQSKSPRSKSSHTQKPLRTAYEKEQIKQRKLETIEDKKERAKLVNEERKWLIAVQDNDMLKRKMKEAEEDKKSKDRDHHREHKTKKDDKKSRKGTKKSPPSSSEKHHHDKKKYHKKSKK